MAAKRAQSDEIRVDTKVKRLKTAQVYVDNTKSIDGLLPTELPPDVELKSWEIAEDLKMLLMYDKVFGGFYLVLSKSTKEGEKTVTLSSEEIKKLYAVSANILTLSQRYSGCGRNINFTFDLSSQIKAKLDFSGFGSLDIRRYFLGSDDKEVPTKCGVRIVEKSIQPLLQCLINCQKMVGDMTDQSATVLKKCKMALMVREIAELQDSCRLNTSCPACLIQDPSQDHHICLTDSVPDWAQAVDMYVQVAEATVVVQMVEQLAEKVGRDKNIVIVDADRLVVIEPEDKLFMKDQKNFQKDKLYALCAKLSANKGKKQAKN